MKKLLTVLMAMTLLFSSVPTEVFATEMTSEQVDVLEYSVFTCEEIEQNARSTTFSNTAIDVACSASGMDVTIYSTTNQLCSVIGVKDVKVQLKNGNDWVTVAISGPAEDTNVYGMGMTFIYPDAIY